MASPVDIYPGSTQDMNLRVLPEGGHEVPVILLLTIDGQVHAFGKVEEDLNQPEDVMVRLGTKASDGHPSSVGFRVFLRTETPKANSIGSIEDHYHIVSCRFDVSEGEVSYAKITAQERDELAVTRSIKAEELKPSGEQHLYQLKVVTSDTNACIVTRHGPKLQTTNEYVKKTEKLMRFIAYASKISLSFFADKSLMASMDMALENGGVGTEAPSWKINLPNDSVTDWSSNMQMQTVMGLTDVLNVLRHALHEKPLQDGPGTSLSDRLQAQQFKSFIRNKYPNTQQEPANKVYPIMLNVPGLCTELPFGASMLNRLNTYAAINALHELLAAQIPASDIGIVTLYHAQAVAYKDALDHCHTLAPQRGYNHVQVNILEGWVHRTVGIAIVDLVRTANASGNLGYLSQANRLKVLLSRHQNGLIIVGDIACTTNSHGTITSAKLEKVLQWFIDHCRIVQISEQGNPLPTAPILPERDLPTDSSASRPTTPSISTSSTDQPPQRGKYVGIPGLEHLRSAQPFSETPKGPIGEHNQIKEPAAANAPHVNRKPFINSRSKSSVKELIEDITPISPAANGGIQRAGDRPNPPIFTTQQVSPSPLNLRPIAKGVAETSGVDTPIEEKMANLRLGDVTPKTSAAETNKLSAAVNEASNDANLRGNAFEKSEARKPFYTPAGRGLREGDALPLKTSNGLAKKEISTDAFDQLWKESSSKFSPRMGTSSGAGPSIPSAGSLNAVSMGSATRLPAQSEDNQSTAMDKSTSSQASEAKKENLPHLGEPFKLPPHKAPPKLSTQSAFLSTANGQGPVKTALTEAPAVKNEVVPSPEQLAKLPPHKVAPGSKKENVPPSSQSAKLPPHKAALGFQKENVVPSTLFTTLPSHKASVKFPTQGSPSANGKGQDLAKAPLPSQSFENTQQPSVIDSMPSWALEAENTTTNQSAAPSVHVVDNQQPMDFKTHYQPKYKTIRSHFATLDPALPRFKEQEDHLFRCLAEALMDEDANAFDAAYTDLLGKAAKAQTSVLKAKR